MQGGSRPHALATDWGQTDPAFLGSSLGGTWAGNTQNHEPQTPRVRGRRGPCLWKGNSLIAHRCTRRPRTSVGAERNPVATSWVAHGYGRQHKSPEGPGPRPETGVGEQGVPCQRGWKGLNLTENVLCTS